MYGLRCKLYIFEASFNHNIMSVTAIAIELFHGATGEAYVPGTMYVRERRALSIWETAPAFFVMKSPYMLRYGRKASSLDTLPMGCGLKMCGGAARRRKGERVWAGCADVIGGRGTTRVGKCGRSVFDLLSMRVVWYV